SSGIPVSDACQVKYTGLQRHHLYRYIIFKINAGDSEVVVDHRYRSNKSVGAGASEAAESTEGDEPGNTSNMECDSKTQEEVFADFVSHLPENECRYAVFDGEFSKGEVTGNKIVFIAYSPDNSKIKQKMLYASTKDALTKKLPGIFKNIQINEFEELTLENIQEKVGRI
ncbi:cofilin, partial [Coemansia sp. RSA 2599]